MTALAGLAPTQVAEAPARARRGRRRTAYLLLLPGGLWLLVFFALPLVQLFATSLYDPSGSLTTGYRMAFAWQNYVDAVAAYAPQFLRAFLYAGIATVLGFLLGYPLAYTMAFKAGRWKNVMLVLVVAPFFTSFLVRTLAWKSILADNGPVLDILRAVGLVAPDGRLLATSVAVVTGLTYNFLPFMVLPIYAALEKLDPRLVEAAGDLYANPVTAFRKVTLPLSASGVVAGTLMTFIPAAGDYVNAQLLGTPNQYMVGNVINSSFLVTLNYPQAAALSFLLMAIILLLVVLYVRRIGTKELV
ncbi:ABC transporter permease [Georgenia thermotolerans]|uniref:ABC transporter permease subunit n=1 Tax=Georgenia thermotolerans TaxID=527326 RepID=A0A7J5UR80_9MICO|nr:ABC transporter permease [Georgenia thermotolerans]KAE8764918.1 ABC transporter permease subunit [Georgenia thermotolerans]